MTKVKAATHKLKQFYANLTVDAIKFDHTAFKKLHTEKRVATCWRGKHRHPHSHAKPDQVRLVYIDDYRTLISQRDRNG